MSHGFFTSDNELVQSNRSQYTIGSKSACSIIAAEAALQLLNDDNNGKLLYPTIQVLDAVLDTCSNIVCKLLSFDEVLNSVDRYLVGLQRVDQNQFYMADINLLKLFHEKNGHLIPYAFLLTKPPESLAIIVQSINRVIVFDSHNRINTTGAYFVVCSSMASALREIQKLWPLRDPNALNETTLRTEMANLVEYVAVVRSSTRLSDLPTLNVGKLFNELALKFDDLSSLVNEHSKQLAEMSKQLAECQLELQQRRSQDAALQSNLANFFNSFLGSQPTLTQQQRSTFRKLMDSTMPHPSPAPITVVTTNTSPSNSGGSYNQHPAHHQHHHRTTKIDASETQSPKVYFQCCQCKRDCPIDNIFTMTNCNHRMCRSCARHLIANKVRRGSYPISCPIGPCGKTLDRGDVEVVLTPEEEEKFANEAYPYHDVR